MIKNMKRLIRNLFFVALLVVLVYAGVRVGFYLYNDLHGNEAKKYLVEKYGFDEKDLFVEKYEQFVFKDVAKCDSLWLKECTDDENLAAKIYFKTKDEKKIVVTEDNNAQFEDDYTAEPTKAWQEKKAHEEEIKKQQEEQRIKDRETAKEREAEKNNKK